MNLYSDQKAVDQLHEDDALSSTQSKSSMGLSPEETFPRAFEKAFRMEAEVLKNLWRPNIDIRRMISELEQSLEPSIGGQEERKEAGNFVVGVHVR